MAPRVAIAELRQVNETLRSLIDRVNSASCDVQIILSDVLEYVFEPLLSLGTLSFRQVIVLDTNAVSELIKPAPADPVMMWAASQSATDLYTTEHNAG